MRVFSEKNNLLSNIFFEIALNSVKVFAKIALIWRSFAVCVKKRSLLVTILPSVPAHIA